MRRVSLMLGCVGFSVIGCGNDPDVNDGQGGFTSTDTMGSATDTTMTAGVTESGTTGAVDGSTSAATTESASSTSSVDETTTGTTGEMVGTTGTTCIDEDVAGLCFDGPALYPAVGSPTDVTLADFDGDGNLDVATAQADTDEVLVRFGDGTGTFGAALSLATQVYPVRVEAADLNGDSSADLVVINQMSDSVQVWLSTGSGAFADPATYAVGSTPADLDILDVSNDTFPEIVVANSGDASYHALVNDGEGGFTVGGPYSMVTGMNGVTTPRGIALGSIASTDDLDVFFVGGSATGASPGAGDGTFNDATIITSPAGTDLRRLEMFDLNPDTDADADFIAVDPEADAIVVFQGADIATFEVTTVPVGTDPVAVDRADIDGTGAPEVAVANLGDDTISILSPDDTGVLQSFGTLSTGTQPSGVALGDLNGDGLIDIVVPLAGDDELAVYLQAQ